MSGHAAASSLYAGIFGSKSGGDVSGEGRDSNDDAGKDSASGAATGSSAVNDSLAAPAASSAPQAWSAALRFAPRRSNNAARNKKPIAISVGPLGTGPVDQDRGTETPKSSESNHHLASRDAQKSVTPFIKAAAKEGAFVQDTTVRSTSSAEPDAVASTSVLPKLSSGSLLNESTDANLAALPAILRPPELSLPEDELEADRQLFQSLAEKRGERPLAQRHQQYRNEEASDEDVNGFAATAEGQKARKKRQKRRRHNSPGRHGGLIASMNMDADYDVGVPNDYNDFKSLVRKRREAIKRIRQEAETEEALAGMGHRPGRGHSDHHSDDESEEDDDVRIKQRKYSRFAPPPIYKGQESKSPATQTLATSDDEKPYISLTPPPEEPSHTFVPPPGPPPGPPPMRPQGNSEEPSAKSLPAADSGEEAYLRRVAMSQAATGEDAYQQRLRMSQGSNVPSIESSSNPTVQQVQPENPINPDDFASRAAAAAAIAARLSRSAKPSQPVVNSQREQPAPTHTDPSTFAERLMMKQGWKRGEALGAEGNKGMLDPILAEKVERERKKQREESGANGKMKASGPRGNIVNAQEEARRREERSKYGEPSEIILLENMIAGDHEIDDELPTEIGDECAKHGYVEQVFVWPARKAAEHGHIGLGPRIFVRFSGMAGAWRCLKELDGRFFGGRTVSARYYPPTDFSRGQYGRKWSSH